MCGGRSYPWQIVLCTAEKIRSHSEWRLRVSPNPQCQSTGSVTRSVEFTLHGAKASVARGCTLGLLPAASPAPYLRHGGRTAALLTFPLGTSRLTNSLQLSTIFQLRKGAAEADYNAKYL